jgi:hypothetical protein
MQETRSTAIEASDRALDEASAFAWLRHYAPLLVAAILAGAAVAGVSARLRPPSAEAWTYVLQTPYRLPRAQLGLMSKAIFASPVVFRTVERDLAISESEQVFHRSVEVRPVPQTNTLIVVGRAADPVQARELSAAAARGLVKAFRRTGVPEFVILGTGPPAIAPSVSDHVIVVATILVELIAAVVTGLVHFGVVRPILSLDRAIAATRASRLVEVGRVRPLRLMLGRERHELPVAPVIARGATVLTDGGRSVRGTADRLVSAAGDGERRDGAGAVVVAGPATRESFLLGTRLTVQPGADLTLIWVR